MPTRNLAEVLPVLAAVTIATAWMLLCALQEVARDAGGRALTTIVPNAGEKVP